MSSLCAQALKEVIQAVAVGKESTTVASAVEEHSLKDREHIEQLRVIRITIPAFAQDAVVRIASYRNGRIVHEDALLQRSPHDAELFEESTPILRTVLAVQSMLNQRAIRIQSIHNLVCVRLLRGGKYGHFEGLCYCLQELVHVRAKANSSE